MKKATWGVFVGLGERGGKSHEGGGGFVWKHCGKSKKEKLNSKDGEDR